MKLLTLSTVLLFSTQQVYAQPANDECVDATIVPPTINPFPYTDVIPNFINATEDLNDIVTSCSFIFNGTLPPFNGTSPPESDSATSSPTLIPTVRDVWYTWTPTSNGLYDFSTVESKAIFPDFEYSIYPSLAIFEGNDCGVLQEVTCGYSYIGAVELLAGKKYYIQIKNSDYEEYVANVVFSITETPPPPPNDECSDAIIIPTSASFPYSTEVVYLAQSTASPSDPILSCTVYTYPPSSDFPTSAPISVVDSNNTNSYGTVWYSFTPPTSDRYDFTTKGSKDVYGNDVIGAIGIFQGETCASLDEIECKEYGPLRRVTLDAGVQYFIMFQVYDSYTNANLTLTVKPTPPPPPNDDCVNAITVDPFATLTYTADISGASPDNVTEGYCGVQIFAPGAWYKTTNTLLTAIPIVATTCNNDTNFDTQISVFKGDSCGNLECVGGNDDSLCGLSSRIQFLAAPQTTYYILVHGFSEDVGSYTLTVEGSKNYFALIDSKTDKAIDVIDTYLDYSSIASTTSSLNIEAVFTGQTSIRSVKMTFDNPPVSYCENKAPFSVFRDTNGNFRDAIIPVGAHEVTATAYGRQSCAGPAGTSISKSFDVTECYLSLLAHDGDTTYDIFYGSELASGCNVNIEVIPFCGFEVKEAIFALNAINDGNTTSVVLTRTEKVAPFFLFGNNGAVINDGTIDPGLYSLGVTLDGIKHTPIEFFVGDTGSCN